MILDLHSKQVEDIMTPTGKYMQINYCQQALEGAGKSELPYSKFLFRFIITKIPCVLIHHMNY